MTSNSANASWHPALMPNATGAIVDAKSDALGPSTTAFDTVPLAGNKSCEQVESTPQSPQVVEKRLEETSNLWAVADATQDESDDWPVFDAQTTDSPVKSDDPPVKSPVSSDIPETESTQERVPEGNRTEPESVQEPAPEEDRTEPENAVESAKPPAPTLGHTSTNSFTRTVSHEVNWDDDQDTEWTLSRTDTDPFKFMPPSDRTNSFPPVPPIAGAGTSAPATEQPLPSNQVEELMNDIESTPELFDADGHDEKTNASASFDSTFGAEDNKNDHFIGRDATLADQESRYEEGIPLIPHTETNAEAPRPAQKLEGFGQDGSGEDDFFSQIQNSNSDDFPDFAGNQPLERKSTMQVLGAMDTSAPSREDTLEDMLEEEEEDAGATNQPTEISAGPEAASETLLPSDAEETEAKSTDDIAAKWEQAFADEDDEDFLLDDITDEAGESKPVDPAAFFGSDDEAATSSASSPTLAQAAQPPQPGSKAVPALRNKESFFEDLPVVSKPRSASRQSYRASSPSQPVLPQPLEPPTQSQLSPSPLSPPMASPYAPNIPRSASGGIPNLVPGERVNPYAPQSTHQQAPGIPSNARYSPAPPSAPTTNGANRPPAASRYSPAPTVARPPVPSFHSTPPSVLPHLPRTSSPLAHFEVSREVPTANGDHGQERRSSYSVEPRITRVPSLPTTREVEEEDDLKPSQLSQAGNGMPAESRYSPAPPMAARQTPPPSSHGPPVHSVLSPSKRSTSNYMPQAAVHDSPPDNRFAPPPRSQTQSPGSSHGARPPSQPLPRPSSVHSPTSPRATRVFQPTHAPVSRPRGPSQTFNMIAPTDGRENDALQRWKGAPIISWGVGGAIVTSFPKNVPRYGIGQSTPSIIRSPGEVHVKHVKDIQPLEERLAKFPGPLRGKSKKKETIAWLTSGIETLERELPHLAFHTQLSHEHKRAVERVLLWKILKIFIEFDGVLEGAASVDKAVRDVLSPGLTDAETEQASSYGAGLGADVLHDSSSTQLKADAVDSSTMDQIRKHLLVGDREKAVWAAVDKRLWGHAMLISNTVSPDLYKQVAQEFVRKEVNYPGHTNESVAALYKVLSGNFDDCVDELVPAHARAGFQLVNTASSTGPSKDATEGLDKWRETLGLVLSNRSPEDIRALNALGNLLSSYGRAEAAHVCFLFARKVTLFGGLDDVSSNFVLVGADHKTQGEQFAKETEALLLSEVYEYGLSLSGGSTAGVPHLAAYKLQHALTLAEYGLRDKALQYCEAIASSISAQTKRSPYHHPILETAVENLRMRLRQAPKEESSSWITKPSMNKVSDSVWNRFNKFVAGDENDGSAAGGSAEGGVESGPFARLAGGTPTISRSPSVTNFEPIYGAGTPNFAVGSPPTAPPVPATRAASRYAPASSQAPVVPSPYEPGSGYAPATASVGRSSNEFSRNPYEPRSSMESQHGQTNGGYVPQTPVSTQGYTPFNVGNGQDSQANEPYGASQTPTVPAVDEKSQAPMEPNQQSQAALSSPGYQAPSYGYEPPSMVPNEDPEPTPENGASNGGYEPPTYQPYSYEPPSYNAEPSDDDEASERKPKPKSFMDDDDDDIPALKAPQSDGKSKSEKDKENEEMFKRAAEEDAKRAAAAQQQSKKGWGFGSWFGGSKKEASPDPQQPNKPVRANLGEASSFVYDPDLKRWVNKKARAEATQAKTATPPPPKAGPPSSTGTPPPPRTMTPPMGRASAPPGGPPGPGLAKAASQESLGVPLGSRPPGMIRSVSNTSAAGGPPSGPPSRPATSMSNASSIDDLLSAAGPRKPGAKKAKKGGRYVDVMAK
ncbi:COPII coat assembly protein sec16 [Colletotrichum chlorophyti]|uniref:Protein transport protein sec16 n=1 Tax=Colletotrichum chlorophyti TaxID=708187 RepID=A0A1Q8RL96_9PEZI|nr:COPII coat assembly protein sec16 [Colletotrichum chlorophyti]